MIRILYTRSKCIGCGYCSDLVPERWEISKKDGKSNLIGSNEKKGVFSVKVFDFEFERNKKAEEICPIKIIKVDKI
jgi:ferredoxin